MDSLVKSAQDNMKEIFHTALVGVKPADQVLVKGYLRLLLHSDVALEWVSAKHPQIDLFLIGHEFRQVSGVTKLLAEQTHKPILYISRNNGGAGSIVGDQLNLPLKKLGEFNDWLLDSVPLLTKLHQDDSATDITTDQSEETVSEKDAESSQTLTATATHTQPAATAVISAHQANAAANKENASNMITSTQPADNSSFDAVSSSLSFDGSNPFDTHEPKTAPLTDLSIKSERNYQGIIAFIQALQSRPVGFYQIESNDQIIAIAEPQRARVWCMQTDDYVPTLDLDWHLQPYNGEQPAASTAKDLSQWLWQYAWQQSEQLLPLANDDTSYQLRYWIKPFISVNDHGNHSQYSIKEGRRELLQVMTALESGPHDVNQLATLEGISVKTAKKIIVSLLFSGSLQSENYHQLDTLIDHSSISKRYDDKLESVPLEPTASTKPVDATNNGQQSALEALLDRRARGEVTTTLSTPANVEMGSTSTNATSSVADILPSTPAQQEKRGFLLRLRQKLGL